jgi:CO dehydrogenase/acetyl-CoA synthase delta subunit
MIILDVNEPIKVYTVWVHDASTERKTADKFLTLLEEVVKEIEEKWGSVVVAIVTDASGECRKARREFVKKYPWIIALDCFAHQVRCMLDKIIYEYLNYVADQPCGWQLFWH